MCKTLGRRSNKRAPHSTVKPQVFLGGSRVLALVPTSAFLLHALPQTLGGHSKGLVQWGLDMFFFWERKKPWEILGHDIHTGSVIEWKRGGGGKGARGLSGKQKSKGAKVVFSRHEKRPVTSGQDACGAVGFMQVKKTILMEAWSKARWASCGRTVRRDVVTLKQRCLCTKLVPVQLISKQSHAASKVV